MEYRIEYMPLALEHLRQLGAREQRIVVDAIDAQLRHQPDVHTRNRKPIRPNDLATWELRIGHVRVFYDILAGGRPDEADGEQPVANGAQAADRTVSILAIGVKKGNRLFIGDEEIEL